MNRSYERMQYPIDSHLQGLSLMVQAVRMALVTMGCVGFMVRFLTRFEVLNQGGNTAIIAYKQPLTVMVSDRTKL